MWPDLDSGLEPGLNFANVLRAGYSWKLAFMTPTSSLSGYLLFWTEQSRGQYTKPWSTFREPGLMVLAPGQAHIEPGFM